MYKCILISGISGSGKSLIGSVLAERLGYQFVEGDSFYLKDKPKATLSNGGTVSNWDTPEAIDWNLLNKTCRGLLYEKSIVLVTFLPLVELFDFPIHCHIRLEVGENVSEKCICSRSSSKNFSSEKKNLDELVVKELVIPMCESLKTRKVDCEVRVYDKDTRRSVEDILKEIDFVLQEKL